MGRLKRYSFIFIFSILIIVLQQALFSRVDIFNATFDLVFVFIICFSLVRGEMESVAVALFCGIIRDSFFPEVFGINTVIYLVSAYVLGQVQKKIYKDAVIIPMLSAFSLTIFKALLYFGYLYIASIKFDFRYHVVNVLLLESIYNSLISLIIYRVVKKINIMKIMQQDWRF